MNLDLNGNWKGEITYGKEYGLSNGKKLIYHSEITQNENKIEGISFDISGFGTNSQPADFNGEIKNLEINFIKQYRTKHFLIPFRNKTLELNKKGPEIFYKGIFDTSSKSFYGDWTMVLKKKLFFLIPITLKFTGTWTMIKN